MVDFHSQNKSLPTTCISTTSIKVHSTQFLYIYLSILSRSIQTTYLHHGLKQPGANCSGPSAA